MNPFQYQKPPTLLQDLTRQLLFGDVFLTFPSLRLSNINFRLISFPIENLFKAFQTFSSLMIRPTALVTILLMKPRLLPQLIHTLYTPLLANFPDPKHRAA